MKLKVTTLITATLVGIYFGLFSCGGHAWHKPAAFGFLALLATASLLQAKEEKSGLVLNVAYVLLIPVTFILAEAGSAPFYPSSPESVQEYFQSALRVLENGPC